MIFLTLIKMGNLVVLHIFQEHCWGIPLSCYQHWSLLFGVHCSQWDFWFLWLLMSSVLVVVFWFWDPLIFAWFRSVGDCRCHDVMQWVCCHKRSWHFVWWCYEEDSARQLDARLEVCCHDEEQTMRWVGDSRSRESDLASRHMYLTTCVWSCAEDGHLLDSR